MGLGTGGAGWAATLVASGLRLWPGPRRLRPAALPPVRRDDPPRRVRGLTSEQRGRQPLAALEDPRVVVADRGEQPEQVLTGLVPLVA
jgi:hypothetical protein